MNGCAETSTRQLDASTPEPPHDPGDRQLLGGDGDGKRASGRAHARLGDERREQLGEPAEQAPELRRREAKVVVAEHRLVRALALLGDALGVLARETDVAFERRCERREVILGTRRHPALLPVGARSRELRGELVRHPPRALPVAPGEAHDVPIERLQLGVGELAQPFADVLRRRALVAKTRERAELRRTCRRAVRGHHHELVPPEQHLDRAQVRQLGQALAQISHRLHPPQPMHDRPRPGPSPPAGVGACSRGLPAARTAAGE